MEFHHQVATTRRSVSPLPPPPSPPLSPDSAAAEALANARWTPTKEQISVLEELYREGMRTPTAEQIQHLTVRLREHGPIEGKNIFYWFQNHKARQRQRQKQQTFDYFARQFHRPQPLPMLHRAPTHPFPRAGAAAAPPPPSPMIVQALQAQPQHRAGNRDKAMYMQQQREVYMASGKAAVQAAYYSQIRAQQTPIYYQYLTNAAGVVQEPIPVYSPPATGGYKAPAADARSVQPKTLTLFPLNPTFAHREKKPRGRPRTASSAMPSTSASASASASAASFSLEPGTSGSGSLSGEASVPFFDFFTLSSGGL